MRLPIDQLKHAAGRPAGAAAVTLLLGLGAPASASAVEPDLQRSCARYASEGVRVRECVRQLRIARDATAKYRDSAVALREGFVPGECEERPGAAMGEHWNRIDRMADDKLDPREPEILLYINTRRGRRLVAAEWSIVARESADPRGETGGLPHYGAEPPDPERTAPPPRMFGGRTFDGPMQGHNLVHAWNGDVHLTPQPWHYDLHVWLWERNPDGIFAQFNPRLSCKGGAATGNGNPPAIRLTVQPKTVDAGEQRRFTFTATAGEGSRPVRDARVRFAGGSAHTNARGRAVFVRRFSRPGRYQARADKRGMRGGTTTVAVRRRAEPRFAG